METKLPSIGLTTVAAVLPIGLDKLYLSGYYPKSNYKTLFIVQLLLSITVFGLFITLPWASISVFFLLITGLFAIFAKSTNITNFLYPGVEFSTVTGMDKVIICILTLLIIIIPLIKYIKKPKTDETLKNKENGTL